MSNHELDFTDARMLRIKAEEKLKEKKKTDKPVIEADVKKLLHELQVHQIELEMQNEELHEANETAETALKKYTMLYDFSPMGYFTLEKDGSISELNFTGAEMLGDKRFSLVNSNFKLFVSEDSLPVFNNFFKKAFASHKKESCELMLGYDKKTLCFVYMEGIVIDDDGKCLLSVVNISSFRK
jgi:transcriptional regulator with PAS, ATPase and Fis domain